MIKMWEVSINLTKYIINALSILCNNKYLKADSISNIEIENINFIDNKLDRLIFKLESDNVVYRVNTNCGQDAICVAIKPQNEIVTNVHFDENYESFINSDMNIYSLVQKLECLFNDYKYDGLEFFDTNEEAIADICSECNKYLIKSDGRCNWININILKLLQYSIFPGEKDSFGWLSGCITKEGKPILVYG